MLMRTSLVWLCLLAGSTLIAGDAYETRVDDDFVENTTFRFRTKYNRAYIDTPDGEFKALISRKTDVPPLLDGILEDPCWRLADHTKSAFVLRASKNPARKQTVAYVCHDDKCLYVATVAEEPQLKGLQMFSQHPGGKKSWATAGMGDCFEMFIELGGVGGTGQVFQFVYNIHPEVRYDGLFPPYVPFIGTGYKLTGAIGAKRWICEMAFPYRGFNADNTDKVDYRYQGPPRRGEVWGLRVMRFGPKFGTEAERMGQTWTHNPNLTSNHIPFPTGTIVFEHRNALHNGKMNEVDPATNRPSHWKLAKTGDLTEAGLHFDQDAGQAMLAAKIKERDDIVQVSQKFGVLPNVGYRLTARLKKLGGDGKVMVGVDRPFLQREITKEGEWEVQEIDFYSEPLQREGAAFIQIVGGSAKATVDEIRVEQQIYGAPEGAICLTGNSPRVDLNVDQKSLEKVRYTYRKPDTDEERFPFRKQWSPGWTNGMADAGGTRGWVAATEGSLTKLELLTRSVEWSHPRPSGASRPLYTAHDVIFDLGREFHVRTVELLPLSVISNMTVSMKAKEDEEWILVRKLRGAGVLNPPAACLFGRLHRIDSVGRYLKIGFYPGGSTGHGMYFIRIWGAEKEEHSGIRRFRWKEGLVVPEVKYDQFEKLTEPVLMPTPQEVEWGEGAFVVTDGIPVYYRREGRAEAAANCLVDEVRMAFDIKLRPVLETGRETSATARGAIVLGEVSANGFAARLAKERGWTIDADKPGSQGYFLSATPGGVLICGFDQAGTFYGVQTLLQLLMRRDWRTAAAKSVEIRDWPYVPWRMIDFRSPGSPNAAFIRMFARLKGNVLMSNLGTGAVRKMCDDYFISTPGIGAGHSGGSPTEMKDDENWYHLGMGTGAYFRINACPSHHLRYEFYEGRAKAGASGGINEVNINTDEMDGGGAGTGGGARWNADRRCHDRRMTGDELFTEMVIRSYDIFRLYGLKTAMLDTMLMSRMQGGNGDFYNMYKACARIPEDIHLYCWRGIIGQPESNPEYAARHFDRVTFLQSQFPFGHRGKINQAYHVPRGKRVWGIWSTVWGIAGPADQVLAGQFCRSMGSVDGGCAIHFLTQGWNPDSPPVHTLEWARKIGNVQQRLGEIALERELPSWRDGVQKEFFKIDMRNACNWSHIDRVPGDGEGWLDWGPNNDLRRMPHGDVKFEEVPFYVIGPDENDGKSIIRVACQPSGARLTAPNRSAEIPVGKKAASLIFLRTNLGRGHHPGYRIVYEGDGYLTVNLDAMGNSSNGYSCYGLYSHARPSGAGDRLEAHFKSAKHRMVEYCSLFFRPAWLGTTGCGDPVKVTMHEWVNPYPELTIKSVSVAYPPGRTSGRMEALFAITGVVPTPRDLALWTERQRLPLVRPDETTIEPGDVPIIPDDGEWELGEGGSGIYRDATGKEICSVKGFYSHEKGIDNANFFKRRANSYLANGGQIKLAYPQVAKKIALRGLFYWESHSVKVHYGVTSFRRTDYVVEVSPDGQAWTQVAAKQGICGEDGAHVHRLPATPIQYIRVKLSANHYATPRSWGYSAGPGLTWVQLYK